MSSDTATAPSETDEAAVAEETPSRTAALDIRSQPSSQIIRPARRPNMIYPAIVNVNVVHPRADFGPDIFGNNIEMLR